MYQIIFSAVVKKFSETL